MVHPAFSDEQWYFKILLGTFSVELGTFREEMATHAVHARLHAPRSTVAVLRLH